MPPALLSSSASRRDGKSGWWGHPGALRASSVAGRRGDQVVVDVTLSFPQLLIRLGIRGGASAEPSHDHRSCSGSRLRSATPAWCGRGARPCARRILVGRPRLWERAPRAMVAPPPAPHTFSSSCHVTQQIAQGHLQEASLSFLGVGTRRSSHLGQMIALGRDYVERGVVVATFPGLAILLTVLASTWWGQAARRARPARPLTATATSREEEGGRRSCSE
jgi:hypothetical protein